MLQAELEDVVTVLVLDWRVCRTRLGVLHASSLNTTVQIRISRGENVTSDRINFSDQTQPLLPSNYAHTDTSPISVIRRIQDSSPNDAAKISRQRIRAIVLNPSPPSPLLNTMILIQDSARAEVDTMADSSY